jgi:hypothetical protein
MVSTAERGGVLGMVSWKPRESHGGERRCAGEAGTVSWVRREESSGCFPERRGCGRFVGSGGFLRGRD